MATLSANRRAFEVRSSIREQYRNGGARELEACIRTRLQALFHTALSTDWRALPTRELEFQCGNARTIVHDEDTYAVCQAIKALKETPVPEPDKPKRGRPRLHKRLTRALNNPVGSINGSIAQLRRYAIKRGEIAVGASLPDALVQKAADRNGLRDATGKIPDVIYTKIARGESLDVSDLEIL